MNIMINVWEKQGCLIVIASVLNNLDFLPMIIPLFR